MFNSPYVTTEGSLFNIWGALLIRRNFGIIFFEKHLRSDSYKFVANIL